jgi:hypothetical protein
MHLDSEPFHFRPYGLSSREAGPTGPEQTSNQTVALRFQIGLELAGPARKPFYIPIKRIYSREGSLILHIKFVRIRPLSNNRIIFTSLLFFMIYMVRRSGALGCMSVVTVAILIMISCSVAASDLPAGRSDAAVSTSDEFYALSTQSNSNSPDAFLASFSDGTFDIDYIRQSSPILIPSDLNELANGIYVPGPLNWSMSFSILSVFEFQNNGSASFGPEDSVISSVDISNERFTLSQPVCENTPGWGVRTTYTAISEDGLVTLIFVTNSNYVFYTLDGDIDPTEIHMSLRISRYNFSDESNAIGVRILIRSQSSAGMSYQESNDGISLNMTTAQPFAGGSIQWRNSMCVDGSTIELGAAGSWDDGTLTLSYPRANTLIQDVVFKVRSNMTFYADSDNLSPDPMLYLSGLGAASGIVVMSIAFVKRDRRSRNH